MMLHWRSVVFGFILGLALVATRGWAKGEFYREVPRSWVPKILCVHDGLRHSPRPPYRALADVPGTGEGSWQANTGNGFYGGLQLNWSFMRSYGGWILAHAGTADRWAPRTQMLVAYRGYKARGFTFSPWPNTARRCGLT